MDPMARLVSKWRERGYGRTILVYAKIMKSTYGLLSMVRFEKDKL